LCGKKTISRVIILEHAEYQLLCFVVGFNVESVIAVIHRVLKQQQQQTAKQVLIKQALNPTMTCKSWYSAHLRIITLIIVFVPLYFKLTI